LILTLLNELDDTACWASGEADDPATTVMAETCVCMVLAGAATELKENTGARGAFMGNEPAGQRQWQLHSACPAGAAFPFPAPAMTVTAAAGFEVVVTPTRPSLVSVEEFMAAAWLLGEAEPATTVMALPCMDEIACNTLDPPAMTVTAGAGACAGAGVDFGGIPPIEVLLTPCPAWTVIAAGADCADATLIELMSGCPAWTVMAAGADCADATLIELLIACPAWTVMAAGAATTLEELDAEPIIGCPPEPAWTMIADGFAVLKGIAALFAEIDVTVSLRLPLAWAWTVIALPTAVVVVAPARPAVIKLAESIAGALEDNVATSACAPGRDAPPAATVIAASLVPFMTTDEISRAIGDAAALALSTTDCISR
jgi:hypothetical protein